MSFFRPKQGSARVVREESGNDLPPGMKGGEVMKSSSHAVTSRYIHVRRERKEAVLDTYHQELHKKADPITQEQGRMDAG